MTINVGLGTGSKAEEVAHLELIIGAQKEAIVAGLVSAKNLFHSAKELVKLAGHKNVDAFFTPPGAPADPNDSASAPIAPPADPKHAEIAAKAQTEQAKITADAAHQKMKLEAQIAFEAEKFAPEKEPKLLDLQIARERHQQDMQRSPKPNPGLSGFGHSLLVVGSGRARSQLGEGIVRRPQGGKEYRLCRSTQ